MEKPLVIPNNKKVKGLTVFCKVCRCNVSDVCRKTGTKIQRCVHPAKLVFKSYIYEPGSGIRRTRIFLTRDINEAVQQAVQFEREVKGGALITTSTAKKIQPQPEQENLLGKMAEFINFLRGQSGPDHFRKQKSEGHVRDTERSFVFFGKAMKLNGISPEKLSVREVDQEKIGFFHSYLLKNKNFANRTYNRHIANMRGLYNYLDKYKGLDMKNPFNMVQKRPAHTEIKIIEPEEFRSLLGVIKQENSEQILSTGEKKYHWHPSLNLKISYSIALMSGVRREQLVTLRYSDIREDKQNQPFIIESFNLKVARMKGESEKSNKRMAYIPVTEPLRNLLMGELEYEKNRNSNRFLIAPDSKLERSTIMDILSKSFSHYWQKTGINKKLKFSDLRKTYITRMALAIGDNVRFLTNHSTSEILGRHYVNQELIARAASNAEIFPEMNGMVSSREKEIRQLRAEKEAKSVSREL